MKWFAIDTINENTITPTSAWVTLIRVVDDRDRTLKRAIMIRTGYRTERDDWDMSMMQHSRRVLAYTLIISLQFRPLALKTFNWWEPR
jgi:hypothetical protein